MKIKQEDRLPYEAIMQLKAEGREFCGYLRNPLKAGYAYCALSDKTCRTMFSSHRDCKRCLDYFMTNYKLDLRQDGEKR
jgi:hypothetical protein